MQAAATRGGRRYDRGLSERTLSIVAPAFNEERRIGALLERVAEAGDAVGEPRPGCGCWS